MRTYNNVMKELTPCAILYKAKGKGELIVAWGPHYSATGDNSEGICEKYVGEIRSLDRGPRRLAMPLHVTSFSYLTRMEFYF